MSRSSGSPKENNKKKSIKVIQEMFQARVSSLCNAKTCSCLPLQDYNGIGYQQALAELDQSLIHGYEFVIVEPLRLGASPSLAMQSPFQARKPRAGC